jgi:hypothetical protein
LPLIVALLLITSAIVAEYGFDFTTIYLDPYDNTFVGVFRYLLLFAVVSVPPLLMALQKQSKLLAKETLLKGFAFLFLGFLIFAFRSSYNEWRQVLKTACEDLPRYYYKSGIQLIQGALLFAPVFMIWSVKNKSLSLSQQGFGTGNIRPYFLLLAGMIPLITAASFSPDFLESYPVFFRIFPQEILPTPLPIFPIIGFELAYAFDFIATEYFFRGFMIIGLLHFFGKDIILPIACFYVVIHFGKPLGETLSSFFGGIILGVFAANSRNIWGGILVHIGIAWLMELGGTLGRLYLS